MKRVVDVIAALMLALLMSPLVVLIAAAIRLETSGSPLFAHTRIGYGRRRFRVWKFRTMVSDGDAILQRHLADNLDAAWEWRTRHKLRNDPRVTRVGRLLRRTSLDELPQIWNVLLGEMSLVGPRPIVEEELEKYGSAFTLYAQVSPGLTGLWQTSGRNDTSYRRRVELDSNYIRYWSPMMDLHILARTVQVVLLGKGAY